MKRFLKIALIAAGVLLGLFVLAAVLLPFFVDAETLKPKAEAKLSEISGRKVSLGTTTLSLWSGLALHASSLRVGEPLHGPAKGAVLLEAGPTAVHVALWPLLHREVQARSISLERATVRQDGEPLASDLTLMSAVRLDADGNLTADGRVSGLLDLLAGRPRAEATFGVGLAGGTLTVRDLRATAGPLRLDAKGRVEEISATPHAILEVTVALPKSSATGHFDAVVDAAAPRLRFAVKAKVLDLDEVLALASTTGLSSSPPVSTGGAVAHAAASDASGGGPGDLVSRLAAQGTLEAGRCLYRGLEMTDVSANMTIDRGAVKLDRTRLSMFGGTARGSITSRPFEPSRPFSLQQKAGDVAIAKMIAALAPAEKGTLEGTAAMDLALTGRGGAPALIETLGGTGSLAVTKGKIASFGMIKQVLRLLEAAGAKGIAKDETPFDSLTAHFTVTRGVARTEDLSFRSPDLDFDGKGTVGLGGALHLDIVGAFSKAVSGQLVAKTPQLAIRQGADGRLTVPLLVRGTMTSPEVQLDVNKVLHEGLKKQIEKEGKQKLLEKLFGR